MGKDHKNVQLQHVADHFGISLEQIIFFDDDLDNVRWAQQVGVNAYLAAPFGCKHESLIRHFIKPPGVRT